MATPSLTRHELPGALGPILVDVRTSDRAAPRPAVLVLHGFKGFKDWGMFPVLAERIARAGFTAVSWNMSGSGVDHAGDFTFAERFGHDSYTAQLHDTTAVMDALEAGTLGLAPTRHLGLVGHSRGGGVAILAAARDARVQALVTWAAISAAHRWRGREREWRTAGRLDVTNARTGQVLPMYTDMLDDVERHVAEYDIAAAAARVSAPWLLLHGAEDESVPVSEGERLAASWPPGRAHRLILVEGGGHTFGAVHPYAGMTPALAEVFDETLKWLGRHL